MAALATVLGVEMGDRVSGAIVVVAVVGGTDDGVSVAVLTGLAEAGTWRVHDGGVDAGLSAVEEVGDVGLRVAVED